nr:PREDICTED: uncharacterized protein LOC107982766 [Anolis carolinensis]|eukprot:XP_016848452.1 PREDICTED: uncharacterized protein LOC107982766 [Anolis carolinensis]
MKKYSFALWVELSIPYLEIQNVSKSKIVADKLLHHTFLLSLLFSGTLTRDRSHDTTASSEASWTISTKSERRTPPSTSNTSLDSVLSLYSWAPPPSSRSTKILRSASRTSLESTASISSWTASSSGDEPCSRPSSRAEKGSSLVLKEFALPLLLCQNRVRSRQLCQRPSSYPYVNVHLQSNEQKRQLAESTLRSSSRLAPTAAPSLHPTPICQQGPAYLQERGWRIGFLDYKQQELLEWHIRKKRQGKIASPSHWASSTGTSRSAAISNRPHQSRAEPQQSLQRSQSHHHGDYEKKNLLEWNVQKEYRAKDATSVHSVSRREGKTLAAVANVSKRDTLGPHHPPQKLNFFSYIDFKLHLEELHRQWERPTHQSGSMRKLSPAAPSMHSAVSKQGSAINFQSCGRRLSFLSYKEQELLEWNVHKKQQKKNAKPSHRTSSPAAKKAEVTLIYQPHQAGLGHQHPPQKPHSYSQIDSGEKKMHRQRKTPTPQLRPSSERIPTSASFQPTLKDKGGLAHFQGYGDVIDFLSCQEQELLAYKLQKEHGVKKARPSHRSSRPKAKSQAGVFQSLQPQYTRPKPSQVHRKSHSYPSTGIFDEWLLHDWNICKKHGVQKETVVLPRASKAGRKEATRRSDPMTRLVPAAAAAAAPLYNESKVSPAHFQKHDNRTGDLDHEEWQLLACNVHMDHKEKTVAPLRQASSKPAETSTLQSEPVPVPVLIAASPSLHPSGKGTSIPVPLQEALREIVVQTLAEVSPDEIRWCLSQQPPKTSSPKADLLDPSLPYRILESVDRKQAMRDLHRRLAQGLEVGDKGPCVEYPVCLQCGCCTSSCPHPRSKRSPSLVVYPRLRVHKGEVHLALGFILKVKRSEGEEWGLGEDVDISTVLVDTKHPSKREKSRERTAKAVSERTQHRPREEHRKHRETPRQHPNVKKSRSAARQRSAERGRNTGERSSSRARRVSFLPNEKPSPKPSKQATKSSHRPRSRRSTSRERRPHQAKTNKQKLTFLEWLLFYFKNSWNRPRVTENKKQSPVSSSQKPHSSRSRSRGRVAPKRNSARK